MKKLAMFAIVIAALLASLTGGVGVAAKSSVIVVPRDYATIQDAVDAASPGDTIIVQAGEYAGAVIDKELTLIGSGAATIITNLEGSPCYKGIDYLPAGFWLEEGANGTSISHFTFDGAGVSDEIDEYFMGGELPSHLAFAVYSVGVDDVRIEYNTVLGTLQGVSNWYGSNWVISHNNFVDQEYRNGGGLSIVVGSGQLNTDSIASGNIIAFNQITGTIAADFDGSYSMGGITLFGTEDSTVNNNKIAFVNNAEDEDLASGICVTSTATGGRVWPLCVDTRVVNNDGRDSEICLLVDEENSEGLFARGNFGRNVIADQSVDEGVSNCGPASVFVGD